MLWYRNNTDTNSDYYLYLCTSGELVIDSNQFSQKYIACAPLTIDQINDNNINMPEEMENWVIQKAQFNGIKKCYFQTERNKQVIKLTFNKEFLTIDEAIFSIDKDFIDRKYPCEECAQEHKQLRDWLTELKIRRMGGYYPKNLRKIITLDESIEHIEELFYDHIKKPWPSIEIMNEHKQLRDWLMELRERRTQR